MNVSWMQWTEINFLTRKIVCKVQEVWLFLVMTTVKFRNVQLTD